MIFATLKDPAYQAHMWYRFRQDLEAAFEKNLTPLQVRLALQAEWEGKYEVTKEEIAKEIDSFLEEIRRFDTCQRRGQHQLEVFTNITPDHGSESWRCKYCDFSGHHIYY